MHVETGDVNISELLPELQRRVIHLADPVEAFHRSPVIRVDHGTAEDRDPCFRQILRQLLRLQVEVLAVHTHELSALPVGMRVKIYDFSAADCILIK